MLDVFYYIIPSRKKTNMKPFSHIRSQKFVWNVFFFKFTTRIVQRKGNILKQIVTTTTTKIICVFRIPQVIPINILIKHLWRQNSLIFFFFLLIRFFTSIWKQAHKKTPLCLWHKEREELKNVAPMHVSNEPWVYVCVYVCGCITGNEKNRPAFIHVQFTKCPGLDCFLFNHEIRYTLAWFLIIFLQLIRNCFGKITNKRRKNRDQKELVAWVFVFCSTFQWSRLFVTY